MNQEQKICQNCQKDFTIEPADFDFYAKINPVRSQTPKASADARAHRTSNGVKVPPPTFCPECRLVRRMHLRNERALYNGKCEFCGRNTLSLYSTDKPFHIYCHECWWSDKWNIMDYGIDYNFNKTFFQQWRELLERTPRLALSVMDMVNSDYCNVAQRDKECYLISATEGNERVMFANRVVFNKDSLDLYIGDKNELCYELVNCLQCYRLFFSRNCRQCQNSVFLLECSNCIHCFSCVNLRNKRYCIFNKQYTKEEYQNKIKEINCGSFSMLEKIKKEYRSFILNNIYRFATIIKSVNTTGDNVRNAKNCHFCFDVIGDSSAEDCKFTVWAGYDCKDCYDTGVGGGLKLERSYEVTDTGIGSNRVFFTSVVYGSFDVFYSINCYNCSRLFGCIGLRNKQNCILNKQYSKEEYERLVPKIIKHMNEMPYISKIPNHKSQITNKAQSTNSETQTREIVYRYGEFFPPELSPFAYNETIAQEYFPLTKEQVQEQGYRWKDPEPRNYQIDIKTEDLPDHIKDVKDDIVGKVIECANSKSEARNPKQIQNFKSEIQNQMENSEFSNCTTAFKIIESELAFYRRMNLPLPRLCPNCRHYARLKQRNPLKLWTRQCLCKGQAPTLTNNYTNTCQHEHGDKPCPNTFETSYAPDRPEIVYCEQCYLREVV